jgi:hypothetical protein
MCELVIYSLAGQVGSRQSARITCRPRWPYRLEEAGDAAFPSREKLRKLKEVLSRVVETIARECEPVNDQNSKKAALGA